jgi:8-oxo-dGTP pyrophosphatase MutT (NUDIX family)
MSIPFEQSYLGLLRRHLGHQKVIVPAVHAIVEHASGDILFVKRADNHYWVLPAGNLELGESVYDCVIREVHEEAGVYATSATLIAVYSEPRFDFTNSHGGEHQMLAFVFHIDQWSGQLAIKTDETVDARFFSRAAPPDNLHPFYHEMLNDLRAFTGQVILK